MLHNSLTYTTSILAPTTEILFFILHFYIIAPRNTIKSVNLPIDKLGFIMYIIKQHHTSIAC